MKIANRFFSFLKINTSKCLVGLLRFSILITLFVILHAMLPVFAYSMFNTDSPETEEPSEKTQNQPAFDSLCKMGIAILYNNPDSAKSIAQKALSLSIKQGNEANQIRALTLLGASFSAQSNYTEALKKYQEALLIAEKIGDTLKIGNAYNNIGVAHLKISNYKEALECYLKALTCYNTIDNVIGTTKTDSNIGLLYMGIDNFPKALIHFQRALTGFVQQNDSLGIANSLSNIGILYSRMEQADSAFFFMDKAIALYEKTRNQYSLSMVLLGKATVFQTQDKFDTAVIFIKQSLEIARQLGHSYQISMAYLSLAESFLAKKQINTALKYADSAMKIAVESENKSVEITANKIFSKIFEASNEFEKALLHYKSFNEEEKKILNQTKLHQMYNLEIDFLNQSKEIQQLEISRQNLLLSKKNNIIVFIMIAFFLIMGGAYLLYLNHNHRRKAQHHEAILSLNEKKSRAVIEAEIQERHRIGKELHDGLGQILSTVRLNISALQQITTLSETRKNELIAYSLQNVDKAFFELRDISHNLVPSALTEEGLTGAITDLANQMNKSKHLKMNFEAYGLNGSLDALVVNTLYRATQELLTNAIKHAKATTFSVQLIKSKTEITLMVEDNGIGFSMDQTLVLPGGGLSNIQSRVENLNGQFLIDALENRGTIVTIFIPIKNTDYDRKSD